MKNRRIFGIALIIIGAIMLFFSDYIAGQVSQGRAKIANAQSQVDTIDSVFSSSKYTKPFGQAITGSAQSKIDAGIVQADYYEGLSGKLKIGGIILILVGAGLLFIKKKRS
jgi:hypothetical protein